MSGLQYLTQPENPGADGANYGRLRYEDGYYYVTAEPAVLETAKRLFPGCHFGPGGRKSGQIRFRATRRAVGDLNWLMLRYPLTIDQPDQFEADRQRAVHHAEQRQHNLDLKPAVPPASFTGQLIGFQAEAVSYLCANERTLCADEMGLGKTITALATLAKLSAFPALLVVPTNVQLQWRSQAGAFLNLQPKDQLYADSSESGGEGLCHIIRGLKPYDLPAKHLYIIHYGLLRGWRDELLKLGLKAAVFDEIQELRHTGTKKYSVASEVAGAVDYCFGLSGTPIHNLGGEIWSITNILDYHCLGDWEGFSREWCTGYGSPIVEQPEVLNDHLHREGLMIRRRKADVQDQLPPKRRVVHTIDHDHDQYKHLMRDAARLASRYDEIRGWHERGEAALQIEQESRRATGVSKAPYVTHFVRTLLEAGERPIVYAWHHDVHQHLVEKLGDEGWKLMKITGQQTQKGKDRAVREFARGDLQMVQVSLRAAAGLDGLQGAATCVVFAELDWSPAIHSQCEDRLHRVGVGDVESVLCYYLVSQTGYDGVVMDALGLKIGQFTGIMGDPSETEEDRQRAYKEGQAHLRRVIGKLHRQDRKAQAC